MTVASAQTVAIDADQVSKRFGRLTALDRLTVRVSRGEVYALLGPNGAGKTTLIRCILGLVKPDGGEIRVLGRRMPERAVLGHIGYMTQAAALYADLSAEENVRFFAAIQGGGDVEAALRFVDLFDRRRSVTATLSGGMRTRLSLACALVHRPDVLVLDEPTVGVDPLLRAQMWDGLRERAASGATILITTHVMDEAARADRLGLILGGRLIAEGTEDELLARAGVRRLEDAFLRLAEAGR